MRQVPASCEERGRSERGGAHHSPQLVQLLVQHVLYLPVGLDLRDGKQEAPEDLVAAQGVPHLRVVLQRVYLPLPVLNGHPHTLPTHIMPAQRCWVGMHFVHRLQPCMIPKPQFCGISECGISEQSTPAIRLSCALHCPCSPSILLHCSWQGFYKFAIADSYTSLHLQKEKEEQTFSLLAATVKPCGSFSA